MPSFLKKLLFCLLPATAVFAANTQISADKPIVNFSLPLFNSDNYRTLMVRGSEGRYESKERIAVKDLTLSVFSGTADEKVDTLILSPAAIINLTNSTANGPANIRVINDQIEASGTDWQYVRITKRNFKVSIAKHVRVIFQAEFKDFLK